VTLVPGTGNASPSGRIPLSRGDTLGQSSTLRRQALSLTQQTSRSGSFKPSRVSQAGIAAVTALGASGLSRQQGSLDKGGDGNGEESMSGSGHMRRVPSGVKRNQSLVPAASFRDLSSGSTADGKRPRTSTAGYGGFSGRSSAAGDDLGQGQGPETPGSTSGLCRRSSGLSTKQSVTLTGYEHDHRCVWRGQGALENCALIVSTCLWGWVFQQVHRQGARQGMGLGAGFGTCPAIRLW
jgi:hypothetical protein